MRKQVIIGIAFALFGVRANGQQINETAPLSSTAQPASPPSANKAEPQNPLLRENLRSFDPNLIDLTWTDHRWLLTVNGVVLKDFGRKESEGRAAVRLVRLLQLNQYGTIGSPAPQLEYWLSDGAAPRGTVPGCSILTFDPAGLHVEGTLGQWCLRDDRRVLFNFGGNAGEARQALAVMRKYGFARAAMIGQPTPSMVVFMANAFDTAPTSRSANHTAAHDSPETIARKAEELKRMKERWPDLDAETVAQPAMQPLRVANQPRQAFSSNVREYGEGLSPSNYVQPASAIDRGDRVAFDWRQLQVRLDGNAWKLSTGSFVLANFEADDLAAHRALEACQYYRFTEVNYVGRPERHFSYFLVNNLAPRGIPFGVPSESFDPKALKARQMAGIWCLCIGDKALIALGDRKEEATDLLAVIQRQHFDILCRIGKPQVGFTILARLR
jgi:hypothetical protein